MLVVEKGVETNGFNDVLRVDVEDPGAWVPDKACADAIEDLKDAWRPPERPVYAMFATNFDTSMDRRNEDVRDMIQHVTAMPCLLGKDIRTGQIQETIADRLRKAFVVVADITEDNLNTCIEAGDRARRRNKPPTHCSRHPRRPPFMFRDRQVWFYEGDAELLAVVHKIVSPYRRRVLGG